MAVAGYIEFEDLSTGKVYRAYADTSAIEQRLTTLENKESLSVQTVPFTSSDWIQQSGGNYQMSLTGCDQVLKIYKTVNSQRTECPLVTATRTGTKAFTVTSLTAFAGEFLIA